MTHDLLVAAFPLPLSVDEMYPQAGNKRRLSWEAMAWKAEVKGYLNAGKAAPPYLIEYMNIPAIQDLRMDFRSNSQAKLAKEARNRHRLFIEVLFVFTNERSDIDNRIKCLQDTLAEWFSCDGQNYFNDRFVAKIAAYRAVEPDAAAHCEVIVKECEITWHSGKLLAMHRQSQLLRTAYDDWGDVTLPMDYALQTTGRLEAP